MFVCVFACVCRFLCFDKVFKNGKRRSLIFGVVVLVLTFCVALEQDLV